MNKKHLLCGAIIASTVTGIVSCDSNSLCREDFAPNEYQKDLSDIVKFDFSVLTEGEKKELTTFQDFAKALVYSPQTSSAFIQNTRSVLDQYNVDFSDMDTNSPLVRILNAMTDPEIASALQNNDVKRYLELLEQKGVIPQGQTRGGIAEITRQEWFFAYLVVAAVAVAAWAAVVAEVVVLGPSMSNNHQALTSAANNGGTMSIDLMQTDNDNEINETITQTITESMPNASESQRETMINIAKSAYNNIRYE